MPNLIETLAAELERPRELTPRVVNYISGTYGIDYADVGSFLVEKLSSLEEYEVDLILSPLFTPKLTDQAVFGELLGGRSIPREQWSALIQELASRPTRAALITSDGKSHQVALQEVTIERYVHRLRLEGSIPDALFDAIGKTPSSGDRPTLKGIARRAIWENDARRNILTRYLSLATKAGAYNLSDAIDLLNFIESAKPDDEADLLARIPKRQETLRAEINAGSKPFFSERVKEMHGGGRDQRSAADIGITAKENELAFLERLHKVLAETA